MFRNRPVSLALVGLFLWVTGCSSSRQIGIAEVADHRHVRVTTTDGSVSDLYDPRVESDSIGGRIRNDSQVKRFIPLDQVADLKAGGGNQAAAAAVVVIGGLLIVVAVAASEWDLGG